MFGGGGLVGGGQHHGIELLKIKSALAMPATASEVLLPACSEIASPLKRSRYSWVQKFQSSRTAEEKVDGYPRF